MSDSAMNNLSEEEVVDQVCLRLAREYLRQKADSLNASNALEFAHSRAVWSLTYAGSMCDPPEDVVRKMVYRALSSEFLGVPMPLSADERRVLLEAVQTRPRQVQLALMSGLSVAYALLEDPGEGD